MQTENPVYEEIQEILRAIELPSVALVGQRIDSPPALANIREGVREALDSVELPSGSVAIGVGSRGVARIGEGATAPRPRKARRKCSRTLALARSRSGVPCGRRWRA